MLRVALLLAPALVAAFHPSACERHRATGSTPISIAAAKFTSLPSGSHAFDDEAGALTPRGGETDNYALSWG